MISWILFAIFSTWVLINRFSEGGKIEGQPLGMPRGTVRALILKYYTKIKKKA